MQTSSTKNYGQFKRITGNRSINNSHLNSLIKSIANRNLLEFAPILVNEKMEIIDGQHRLEAARACDVPIYYRVLDLDQTQSFEDMIILNTFARSWNLVDYLDSYVSLEKEDYKIVSEIYDKGRKGIRLFIIIAVLSGASSNGQTVNLRKEFKAGNFRIVNQSKAERFLDYLEAIRSYASKSVINQKEFLFALMKIDGTGNIDKLLTKLALTNRKLFKKDSLKEYLRDIEDILHLKAQQELRKDYLAN